MGGCQAVRGSRPCSGLSTEPGSHSVDEGGASTTVDAKSGSSADVSAGCTLKSEGKRRRKTRFRSKNRECQTRDVFQGVACAGGLGCSSEGLRASPRTVERRQEQTIKSSSERDSVLSTDSSAHPARRSLSKQTLRGRSRCGS